MAREANRAVTVAVTVAATANGAAVVALAGIWYMAAGAVRVEDQLLWLNAAVVAVVLALVADAAVVLGGRRALLVRSLRLRALLGEDRPRAAQVEPVEDETPPAEDRLVVVAVAGAVRYHRPGCQLVTDKALRDVTSVEGLKPCGVCQPAGSITAAVADEPSHSSSEAVVAES